MSKAYEDKKEFSKAAEYFEKGNNLNTASLDRIDSKLGYVKGNLQFISIICNQAKNNLTHENMMTFLKTICEFYSKKE